ncbi:MAG: histidine kinase N-terminal 7TM domain-containing protein [Candidatus Marinimicrobia bacterium]|nr:histidine kinase N-terminal 7TM domain-containing protein [Candidatus Neomarinimicrobiota bacterium]
MDFTFSIYYTPLIFAMILSSVVMVYAWRYRNENHGRAFFFLAVGGVWWAFCNIMEYGFNDLEAKQFWVAIEYIGIETVIVAWFCVVANFTGQTKWVTRRSLRLLFIIPVITVIMIMTNRYHGLMRYDIYLDTNGPFSVIKKTYGVWFWVTFAYSNLLMLLSSVMLIQRLTRPPTLRKSQIISLMICALFPWLGNFLFVFKLLPEPWMRMDFTSFCLAISGATMAFGLFRFQLMEVIPIARDYILEDIGDPILVLDSHNRVADYNQACRTMLQIDKIIIAQPMEEVLNPFLLRPDLINELKNIEEEITLILGKETKIYNLRIRPLFDQKQKLQGRIFHFRDITDKRLTEMKLEKTVVELREALTKVKTLSGLLPICSSCKKIRDDNGYWNEVETYIHKYSEVEFSHGICPECMRKLYPEQYDRLVKQGKITDTSAKKK